MSMSWDFTNYTFSFLVSLIGTILGRALKKSLHGLC